MRVSAMSPTNGYRLLLGLLIAFAGAKNWFLSCAHPLFYPADEGFHYDLVCQLADARLPPPAPGPVCTETALAFLLYASPEYLAPFDPAPIPNASRVGKSYASILPQMMLKAEELRQNLPNIEFGSPPVYYAMAALWRKLGEKIAHGRINLIYWQRWFQSLLAMLFVLSAGFLASRLAATDAARGENALWELPLLAAVFPTDYFYYTTPDAMSAVLGALALITLLAPGAHTEHANRARIAAVFFLLPLTRLSAVVWGPVLLLLLACTYKPCALRKRFLTGLTALLLGTALLVGTNMVLHGEPWGVQNKHAFLTWTEKPLSQWSVHPLFSPGGLWVFLSGTVTSFWRGELTWHGSPVALAYLDPVLLALTLIACVAMPVWFLRNMRSLPGDESALARQAVPEARCSEVCLIGSGWLSFVGGLGLLALLSIRYDFGTCYFPSADFPYFTTGRLINTNLLGFLGGMVLLCRRLFPRYRLCRLLFWVFFASLCVASQLYAAWRPLQSPFNWFHLKGL